MNNKEEKLKEAAEALIRSKAFPNGTTDQLWDNFKYEHSGTKWVGFAINAMVDFIKQYHHQQSEAGDTQTELAFKITELITNHTKSLTRKKDSIVIGQGEAAHHIANLVFPHLKQPVESEWVSVIERLPEHNQGILFMVRGEMRKGIFLKKDQWGRENVFCDGAFHTEFISHWMPLPPIPTNKNNP